MMVYIQDYLLDFEDDCNKLNKSLFCHNGAQVATVGCQINFEVETLIENQIFQINVASGSKYFLGHL